MYYIAINAVANPFLARYFYLARLVAGRQMNTETSNNLAKFAANIFGNFW